MCTITFERSFASHPRSANWSKQNVVQPKNVALHSNQKFWFNCDSFINKIVEDNVVQNKFICKNNEYAIFS